MTEVSPPNETEYDADGRHYHAVSHIVVNTPGGKIEYDLVRDSWGLGLTAVRVAEQKRVAPAGCHHPELRPTVAGACDPRARPHDRQGVERKHLPVVDYG